MRLSAALLALALVVSPALAQPYPSRPIRIIVPNAPGGSLDTFARLVAARMADSLGQPVVAENRAGAGGVIATEFVAKAPADGYTLLLTYTAHAVNATLYPKLAFDAVRDFAPIGMVATQPMVLVVAPALGIDSIEALIRHAKAQPGKLYFSSAGSGTAGHLGVELFKSMAGVDIVHVPYKGIAAAFTDLIGGRVHLSMASIATTLPQIKAGKLRGLGITGVQRSSVAPEIPTIAEAGLPGYEMTASYFILAPAGVAPEIVAKLNTHLGDAVTSTAIREKLAVDGAEPARSTPAELGRFIEAEVAKWAKVVKASGAKAD